MDLKNNRFKKLGMIIFSAEIWKASKRYAPKSNKKLISALTFV